MIFCVFSKGEGTTTTMLPSCLSLPLFVKLSPCLCVSLLSYSRIPIQKRLKKLNRSQLLPLSCSKEKFACRQAHAARGEPPCQKKLPRVMASLRDCRLPRALSVIGASWKAVRLGVSMAGVSSRLQWECSSCPLLQLSGRPAPRFLLRRDTQKRDVAYIHL